MHVASRLALDILARMFAPLKCRRPFRWSAAGLLLLVVAAACAHEPGLSTGHFKVLPERIEAELIFARADIETVLKLDADGDGKVSVFELAAVEAESLKLAQDMLLVRADERALTPAQPGFRLDETNNFHLTATFEVRKPKLLVLTSTLIDKMPRGHRQFVSLNDETNGVLAEVLLSAEQDVIEMDMEQLFPPTTFREFLVLGIEHIVTGYDHLLFLFALLVMAPGFRQAALIITSFTVAHSITLGLATLDVVSVGSKYVEPLIAASIIYVGVENLVRRDGPRGRWLLTFVFGLIHGFGFAGVLRELGVSSGTTGITMPLLSFNLGVEAGQIAIAALVLPLIWWARHSQAFLRYGVPACSVVVIGLGGWWLLQRTVLAAGF
jgi:hydrogenase/urease accessory protein HupE